MLLLFQIGILFSVFRWFEGILPQLLGGTALFTVVMVLYLLNSRLDATAKITWLIVIMLVPVFGVLLFWFTDIERRLLSGASILNVAGGPQTPEIVRKIRQSFPEVPIIASGGGTEESIRRTIQAGANAITYTPPTAQELFKITMAKYREM